MKKGWLIGIIILVALVIIIIAIVISLFLVGKKGICGPAFLGEGRNASSCDTSCKTDSDCKYICGCGVINKDEVCDTTGAVIDCFAQGEIKCVEGKCVELKRPANEGVIISTDKTEYNIGEKVRAQANFSGKIYLIHFLRGFWDVSVWANDSWSLLSIDPCLRSCEDVNFKKIEKCSYSFCDYSPESIEVEYLSPLTTFTWDQKYAEERKYNCTDLTGYVQENRTSICYQELEAPPGKYKISFYYTKKPVNSTEGNITIETAEAEFTIK